MTGVLLVDDDVQLLRALRITLSVRGHDVHTACDGKATSPRTIVRTSSSSISACPTSIAPDVIPQLRTFTGAPISVLSARTDSSDKVHASTAVPTTTSPNPSAWTS